MKNRRHPAFDKHPFELGEFWCFAISSAGHAFDATFSRSFSNGARAWVRILAA